VLDTIQAELGDSVTFCYKVKNIGKIRLCEIVVHDYNLNEYSESTECLDPDEESEYFPPNRVTICDTLTPTLASAYGQPSDEKGPLNLLPVTDDDDATVNVVPCPRKPPMPGFKPKPYVCAKGVYPPYCIPKELRNKGAMGFTS